MNMQKFPRLLRYRIVTTRMQGMTAQDPLKGEVKTPAEAIFLYRLTGIFGTTWRVTATWGKMRRNSGLVKTDQQKRRFL
jgi:hypothetical protein